MPGMQLATSVDDEPSFGFFGAGDKFHPDTIPPHISCLWGTDVKENETADVFGAHLLYNMQKHCANCGTPSTPLWRKGWEDNVLGRSLSLCNACGLKYAKNQYCPYCMFVYKLNVDVHSHRAEWVACSTCPRWVHAQCEKRYGRERPADLPYSCPECDGASKDKPVIPSPFHRSSSPRKARNGLHSRLTAESSSESSEEDYPEFLCSTDDEELMEY